MKTGCKLVGFLAVRADALSGRSRSADLSDAVIAASSWKNNDISAKRELTSTQGRESKSLDTEILDDSPNNLLANHSAGEDTGLASTQPLIRL